MSHACTGRVDCLLSMDEAEGAIWLQETQRNEAHLSDTGLEIKYNICGKKRNCSNVHVW